MTNRHLTLVDSAAYCIRVQGRLGEGWFDYLGMHVEVEHGEEQYPITKLTGQVADQAALFGLLDGLYGFGFPLLSVECLSIGQSRDMVSQHHKEREK